MGDVISITKRSLQQKVKKYRNIRDIRRLKEYEVNNILIKLPKVEMKDLVVYLLKQYVFPNLKSIDELDNFTKDIKHIIREEFVKCAQDPVHFMKKYCYIQHPQRGKINFNLFPFQEKVLTLFQENPYSIVLKSRQLGLSTLSAGYALWLMVFHENKNVLALTTTQATARNLVAKVQFMFEGLPSWLKVSSLENSAY